MATTRLKDFAKTTSTVASDDFHMLDGASNGSQKISRNNLRTDLATAFVAAPTTYNLCPLNSGTNKIDATYLPTSGDTPKGAYDANAGSPALADGVGTAGDYYDVTVAGTQNLGSGNITFTVGDVVKYDGATWYKIDSVANFLDGYSTAATSRAALEVNSKDEDAEATATKLQSPAIYFDGSSSEVTVANDARFSFTDGTDDLPFTFDGWIKLKDATNRVIISKFGSVDADKEWYFIIDGSDLLTLTLHSSSGNYERVYADTALTSYEGQWIHVAATFAGAGPNSANSFLNAADGMTLYVNGSSVAITNGSAGSYAGQTAGSDPVRIGSRESAGYFYGEMLQMRIHNRELTATEIAQLARGNDLGFADEWGGAHGGLDTSDFSAGVDGFTGNYGTLTAGTSSEDGIGGEDDWLKFTLNTSSAIHQILSPQVMPVGARVRVEFDCYIPSTNSHVDGVKANLSSTITSEVIATNEGATTDTVFRVSGEGIATGNQRVYITALDGSSTTVSDSGGDDWIAIKNVKISQLGTLASFSAERYDTSTNKLYDISDNAFVGTGTSVSLTGREQPVYETGTWTPSISFGGAAVGLTASSASGFYTRIGNQCIVRGAINLSAKGSSTGAAKITGLPFTSVGGTSMGSMLLGLTANMAGLTSVPTGQVAGNDTTIDLYDWGATGTATLDETNFTDTTYLRFSVTYQIQ